MKLHDEDEIRAAGAAAVEGWTPQPAQVDAISALVAPVLDRTYGPVGAEVASEERAA